MWKIFDGKEVANGVVFIKSKKDFNTVIDITKHIGRECKKKYLNVNYWFLDGGKETTIERDVMKQFLYEMEDKHINLVVVRTLKEISNDALEKEAFLQTMVDCGIAVYLFDEGCFATVNYDYAC
jgi:hypothetical protein